MSINKLLLLDEYVFEYDLAPKKSYSKPKIYDADSNLSKRWYVCYSFRNTKTDKLGKTGPHIQQGELF